VFDRVVWDATEATRATSVDEQTIRQWNTSTMQETVSIAGNELDNFTSGCAIPYKGNQFVVTSNQNVKLFDLASKKYVLHLL